jgi:hypothetical protein
MTSNVEQLPTRTPETEADYLKRAFQLREAIKTAKSKTAASNGQNTKFTLSDFVDGLLEKRETYRRSSWRYNRSAAIFALEKEAFREALFAEAIERAITRLCDALPPNRDSKPPPRTSSTKSKRFSEEDVEEVVHLPRTRRSRFVGP